MFCNIEQCFVVFPKRLKLPDEEAERFYQFNGHKKYRIVDGVAVYDETLPDYRGVFELENELEALSREMASRDYLHNKYLRGDLSDERWEETKAWYAVKTAKHDELVEQIALLREEEAL